MTEAPPPPAKTGGLTRRRKIIALILCGVIVAAGAFTVASRRAATKRRAADKIARENLSKAMAATDSYFAENDRYTGFDTAATAEGVDPSIAWSMRPKGVAAIAVVGRVYALVVTTANAGDTIVLGVMSDSGTVFGLSKVGSGIAHECRGENFTALTYAGCTGGW